MCALWREVLGERELIIYIFLLHFDSMDVTVLLVDMNIRYPGNFCVFETTP